MQKICIGDVITLNQILYTKDNNYLFNDINEHTSPYTKRRFFLLKFQIYTSLIIMFFLILFYSYNLYTSYQKEQLSKSLINNFNISRLYASNTNYSTNLEPDKIEPLFSVIGLIEIESLNINYPIISTISEDLLKIAPCRFYGPAPNEIGNLCIAAHNYNNYKFFSKIHTLNIGDIISIYDLNGLKVDYSIYIKEEIKQTDTYITKQDTNGIKEITLLTCNNIKGKRLVIKAKEGS